MQRPFQVPMHLWTGLHRARDLTVLQCAGDFLLATNLPPWAGVDVGTLNLHRLSLLLVLEPHRQQRWWRLAVR